MSETICDFCLIFFKKDLYQNHHNLILVSMPSAPGHTGGGGGALVLSLQAITSVPAQVPRKQGINAELIINMSFSKDTW